MAHIRVLFCKHPSAPMKHNSSWSSRFEAEKRARELQDKGFGTDIVYAIQTWNLSTGSDCSEDGEDVCHMVPVNDGDWVRFADLEITLDSAQMRKALNSEIAKKKRPGAKGLIRNPKGRPKAASKQE